VAPVNARDTYDGPVCGVHAVEERRRKKEDQASVCYDAICKIQGF